MYSAFDHWEYWSHMLTVLSMFSPCTQWVFGSLSPVLLELSVRAGTGIDVVSTIPQPTHLTLAHPSNRGHKLQWVLSQRSRRGCLTLHLGHISSKKSSDGDGFGSTYTGGSSSIFFAGFEGTDESEVPTAKRGGQGVGRAGACQSGPF